MCAACSQQSTLLKIGCAGCKAHESCCLLFDLLCLHELEERNGCVHFKGGVASGCLYRNRLLQQMACSCEFVMQSRRQFDCSESRLEYSGGLWWQSEQATASVFSRSMFCNQLAAPTCVACFALFHLDLPPPAMGSACGWLSAPQLLRQLRKIMLHP